ncbi:MAG TPA: hypothetical protein K8W13_02805 [Enterococcus columbae]|nr:hypothetical protein [Enterococcus columbae]
MIEKIAYLLIIVLLIILQLNHWISLSLFFLLFSFILLLIDLRMIIAKKYDWILLIANPNVDSKENKRLLYVTGAIICLAALILFGVGMYLNE